MNGRVARALRKELDFNPNAKREYHELEVPVMRYIWSFGEDSEGNTAPELVKRQVSAYIKECTDAKRNFYQYLKKKYYNLNYEKVLHKLPSVDDLTDIAASILRDEEIVPKKQDTNK